jgi:phosphate-selective porin OprO/OprP
MRRISTTMAASAFLFATTATAGTVTSDGADLILKTKGGLEIKTADGDYSFKLGGRIQLDYNAYDGVINKIEGETGSDLFFRRARLELKGKVKDWTYLMSYNLTSSGSIDQLNVTYNGWGDMARLQIGQQKENFGLEDTGSSKWIIGLERSLPANAFDTGNTTGLKFYGAYDFLSYSVGIFKESIDADDNSLDSAVTGRVVVRPIFDEGRLVHLGAGFTRRDGSFSDLGARLGVRGGKDKTANKVRAKYDDGAADEFEAWNLEAAAQFGAAHMLFEYFDGEISGNGQTAIEANGYGLMAAYVLTGETRKYKTASASFDKIKPKNAGGAWEIFARYDNLDVTDNLGTAGVSVDAGEANTLTLGVNWYANSNLKLAVNYVKADTDLVINGEDDGNALVARLQFLF